MMRLKLEPISFAVHKVSKDKKARAIGVYNTSSGLRRQTYIRLNNLALDLRSKCCLKSVSSKNVSDKLIIWCTVALYHKSRVAITVPQSAQCDALQYIVFHPKLQTCSIPKQAELYFCPLWLEIDWSYIIIILSSYLCSHSIANGTTRSQKRSKGCFQMPA